MPTQLGVANPQASAENPQLVGENAQLTVQACAVVHYHGAPTPRLPGAELNKRLKDLLQLKCPSCLKDLMAQGHKLLKEAKGEALLHGVFYLATAYELYGTLNIQGDKFDRQTLDQYLDTLEKSLKEGENLLHYFAAQENLSIFSYLFSERPSIKFQLNDLAGEGIKETPLHVAIKNGFTPVVQFLLDQGADVKKLDSSQNNALHHACQSQRDGVDIVPILLEYDSTFMQAKNSDSQTPLHLAALAGNEKNVEYLLGQNADQTKLDQQDREGNTPLHLAIMGWGKSSLVKAKDRYCKSVEGLVKKGTSLDILNHEKKTVLALIFENENITHSLVQVKLSPQLLVSSLRNLYLSQKTLSIFRIKSSQEWEFKVPLEEIYVRLAIIENQERKTCDQKLDKHSNYIQDGRIPTYETIFEPKKNIEIENLFEHASLKGKDKRIYLQGAAGIGKSTLCHYIAYRWAKKDLWHDLFACLFWIPLRNLTLRKYPADKEYTPADLIAKEYIGKIDRSVIVACINNAAFRAKTLLVLDGYDELSSEAQANTSLAKAFQKLKELFPHILITSRPGSCSFNRSCELELLGFDKEGVDRYIDKFFKQSQAKEKKAKLHRLLKNSPNVSSLAHIPIHLTLLCCLCNENPEFFDSDQAITMSAIYARVVSWMYKWFLLRKIDQGQSKQTKEQILVEKNLRQNPEVAKIATVFEEMADFAMKNDTLYLSKQEIEDFKGNKISSNELADCGLMRIPEAETKAEEKGYFIHLTFQEFLTASKVVNQYLKGERQACKEFVRNYKFEPRYALVLRMIAGYLSLATSSNRRYAETLQFFFDDLFAAPQDFAVRSELNLIAECFEECQNPTIVRQYKGFIELVKDYIIRLSLLDLVCVRLLRNKNLLNHPQVTCAIGELLSEPQSRESMLRSLHHIIIKGQTLAPKIVSFIARILKNSVGDPAVEENAIDVLRAVAEQGGKLPEEAVGALIQIGERGDGYIKCCAINALVTAAQQGGEFTEKALAALIQILEKGESADAAFAAYVLRAVAKQGRELPEEAVDALIQVLEKGSLNAKRPAADALKVVTKQGGELVEKALAALIQVLKKGDPDAKRSAADALKVVVKQGGELAEKALAALIQVLEKGEPEAKRPAADALKVVVKQGGELAEKALAALIQVLGEDGLDDKSSAAYAVLTMAKQARELSLSKEAVDILLQIFEEGDLDAKRSVAAVLKVEAMQAGELPKEAFDILLQIFKKGDSDAKRSAAGALEAVAMQAGELPKEAVDALIQVFKKGDPDDKSFAAAVLKVVAMQAGELTEEAVDALTQVLKKGGPDAKIYAAAVLKVVAMQAGELTEEAVDALIQGLRKGDSDAKRSVADALKVVAIQAGELPKEAVDALIQIFEKGDPDAKIYAAYAVGAVAKQAGELTEKALAALIQVLKKDGPDAKRSAADALGIVAMRAGELPKEAVNVLLQIFEKGDPDAKIYAAYAVLTMAKQASGPAEKALAALIQILEKGEPDDKSSATYAVGIVALRGGKIPKEALAALVQFLEKGDSDDKSFAAEALEAVAMQAGGLPKEVVDVFIQIVEKGYVEAERFATHVLRAVAQQGGAFNEKALAAFSQIIEKNASIATSAIPKKVNKKALLKMGIKVFPLTAKACFVNEDSFSVKGQQLQISDQRTTYVSEDELMLSYEEIREKLPEELAEWRKRLDSLSQIGSS
ncbi:ankyrin repeat domain-containing protein [Parachlamydia sp. AcF125]|uniref:ankyrin repeat domain-containing protein n=1 Tax=Parachlamydia sp. AcF125 TaxID=2795736 RepID=UPI001BCA114B|nr:ankyrin repeat domain-containing protein [Parachlamydia sp. AcF125]MBS4168377.1 Phosphocholine transferase AnkX [Parachlamydia sp. AcF125]